MAGAVAGVIISSLWHRAKIMQYANNTDDNSMLTIATISTPVANNSASNIFVVSHLDLRRMVHM
jgi:hypothetical protein